jgi:hypothetical protein
MHAKRDSGTQPKPLNLFYFHYPMMATMFIFHPYAIYPWFNPLSYLCAFSYPCILRLNYNVPTFSRQGPLIKTSGVLANQIYALLQHFLIHSPPGPGN